MPRDFDEISDSSQWNYYYDYFSKMPISEEEIERRIDTAIDFEDEFLIILSFALLRWGQGRLNQEELAARFYDSYIRIGKNIIPNEAYLYARANTFSNQVAQSTVVNIENEYFTSADRAITISETESNVVNNYRLFSDMEQQGYSRKTWITVGDKRVRETHHAVAGKTIGINSYFDVGGYPLLFPSDTSSSPPAEIITNCRCWLKFS